MKTIEERALEYAKKSGIDHYTDYFDFCQQDYIAGATEQKVIDEEAQINYNNEAIYKQGYHDAVEKACEYLDIYFMEIGYPDDWFRDSPNIEGGRERFIKVMEEYMNYA